jgi:hypothetical protein
MDEYSAEAHANLFELVAIEEPENWLLGATQWRPMGARLSWGRSRAVAAASIVRSQALRQRALLRGTAHE